MKMRNHALDDEFYDSLDRILSSSCSSTSASDDESDHRHHHRHRFTPPSSAAVAAAYEVWIAEPGPVEERRRRLLEMMGLAGDTALCREKSPIPVVNSCEVCRRIDPFSSAALLASHTSDVKELAGDTVLCREKSPIPVVNSCEVCRRIDPFSSPALFASHASDVKELAGDTVLCREKSQIPVVNSCEVCRKLDPFSSAALFASRTSDGMDRDDELRCSIRNLDTGSEFVVKEFGEDGMWKKLREIGTGRQLTMEEFEMCVGRSPIVQELMRRQNVDSGGGSACGQICRDGFDLRLKKRRSWIKSIRSMAESVLQQREKKICDERDSSFERGRRSSSGTEDSHDGSHFAFHGAERIRVRQYGKSFKELSGLYLTQEIQAHSGSIWSIRFSLDGRYLASAGEDCVIHVWQAMEGAAEENVNGDGIIGAIGNGTSEVAYALACMEANHSEKKRRPKLSSARKSLSLENIIVPEHFFALEEKPLFSFKGHLDDVLDLSWSKSQYLLSSSMDKTVRLWHMSSITCLKIFSHSDYVTCIQFNPIDDRYFISGSLDKKIRIWSIPDRRVVDWTDLHEMVTAASYTPDGKGALVGSHKGSCYMYDATDNKLHQKTEIDLQNKKKKSNHKKITGFQFSPGSNSELLVTSADSRIRVIQGIDLVHKLKGFRNTSSQISASLTANGNHAICASEDSRVYIWQHRSDSHPRRKHNGNINTTQSYEHFRCCDVTTAVPWPKTCNSAPGSTQSRHGYVESPAQDILNRASVTWPEEKLMLSSTGRSSTEMKYGSVDVASNSAWGMVIVTAGRGGQIRTYQNFGFALRT